MNFIASNITATLIIILAIPYVTIVFTRLSQDFPFVKALNPFYSKDKLESDKLRKTIGPIMAEIETQRLARFIKHWSEKFENNKLTVKDVENLNEMITEGAIDQVNGILAIHPEGRNMFNQINEELRLKQEALAAEEPAGAVMA